MLNTQHGSPYDRGAADSFYGRIPFPHKGGVGGGSGPRIEILSEKEKWEYNAGFEYNEKFGERKHCD